MVVLLRYVRVHSGERPILVLRVHHFQSRLVHESVSGQCVAEASCFMCPAKRSCGSDITLGDFWGFQGIHPEVDYSKGVSAVICNTDKGIAAFQGIANSIDCGEATIEQVLAGNPSLVKSVAPYAKCDEFMADFASRMGIEGLDG